MKMDILLERRNWYHFLLLVCQLMSIVHLSKMSEEEAFAKDTWMFLDHFGYLSEFPELRNQSEWIAEASTSGRHGVSLTSPEDIPVDRDRALDVMKVYSAFQRIAAIPVTGFFSRQTSEVTRRWTRCGDSDESLVRALLQKRGARHRRYTLSGARWGTQKLTYHLQNGYKNLTRAEIRSTIRNAFSKWERSSALTFDLVDTKAEADIGIRFARRKHGDGLPFDGPGKVLGHAFGPDDGGSIHFDKDEDWTLTSEYGIDLKQVSVHEIGHVLGLGHSNTAGSIMSPYYQQGRESLVLHSDDHEAIQYLYGQPVDLKGDQPSEAPVVPLTPVDILDPCSVVRWDAVVTVGVNRVTYFFKDDTYFRITRKPSSIKSFKIADGWPQLQGRIDAASAVPGGIIHLFKGNRVYMYDINGPTPPDREAQLYQVYNIQEVFPTFPSRIQAAWLWQNLKFYVSQEKRYWRHDGKEETNSMYPRQINSGWIMLHTLDAADYDFVTETAFFFRGPHVWTYDYATPASAGPANVPVRQTSEVFFNCPQDLGPSLTTRRWTTSASTSSGCILFCTFTHVHFIFTYFIYICLKDSSVVL